MRTFKTKTIIILKNRKHKILLLFLLVCLQYGFSQRPSDPIIPKQLNEKYLEHLIKIKIDSVRIKNGCKPLVNDSILFLAANFHSHYMLDNNRLTHTEEDQPTYRTPQLRAEAFGATNYYVGENALKTFANRDVTNKNPTGKEKTFNTNTYDGLANQMVDSWVNSPSHFKNIITPEYQVTGLSVAYLDGKIYACQKFAQVLYTYSFEESKALFPYSTYVQEPLVASFAGIRRELIMHEYEWGLKHDQLEKCDACLELEKVKPYITLRYEKNNFILRVENSAYVQELIRDAKDGFAVEIVEYNDYVCGNPAYYTKPSRRNGQLKTNGRLLKPLFRKDLMKGFKKRKKKNDVRYLSYIFGADSVKFINRFNTYKMAKYESEYFEINLGKLPQGVTGLWAHNLAYIQNNQICRFDYFTNFCGELYTDSIPIQFIPLDTNQAHYNFKPIAQSLFFEIPFEQNKAVFTQADIDPFIESLSSSAYFIDSVNIRAYSSVEGDSASNAQLQVKRAKSILAVLQKNQQEPIPSKIETATSWDHFYRQIGRNPTYRQMARKTKAEIEEELKKQAVLNDLEALFAEERRAEIQLYVHVEVNNQNCDQFIKREFTRIETAFKDPKTDEKGYLLELKNFEKLYAYTHRKVCAGFIDTVFLANITLPDFSEKRPTLLEKFFLYGHEFESQFKTNQQWIAQQTGLRTILVEKAYDQMSPIFKYDNAYFNTLNLLGQTGANQEDVQAIIDELRMLERFYNGNPKARTEIENLVANLNLVLLNQCFANNPTEASADATLSVTQLQLFYADRNLLDAAKALQLANTAVFYTNITQAQIITGPYLDNAAVLKFAIPLGYQNPTDPLAAPYYEMLVELSKTRSAEDWCPLFMSECAIPFQALDYEALRDVYCEKCGVYEPDFGV